MAIILVAGTGEGAGASTVAAGLAHRAAHAGHRVALERLAGDARAAADAAAFGRLEIADSGGVPVEPAAVNRAAAVTVLEAPVGANAVALASQIGARLVLVGPEGTATPVGGLVVENRVAETGPLRIAEDRVLAAPTVARLIEASGATVLASSDQGDDAHCEHLVIGAIAHDPDEPYFRRFPRPAIVARGERVDIALAAMRTNPVCLILTGGQDPSPYIVDRVAASRDTTLLLAPGGTVETVRRLEGTFGSVAFSGDLKLTEIGRLARTVFDDAALVALGIGAGA